MIGPFVIAKRNFLIQYFSLWWYGLWDRVKLLLERAVAEVSGSCFYS